MKRKRIVLIVVAAVAVVAVAATAFFVLNPAAWNQTLVALKLAEPQTDGISASGFIEAEKVSIASELGGRIAGLAVEEGDEVEEGQLLARLDDTMAQARLEVAQAGLEVAQARLAQVRAGAREEQLAQAQARLQQAEAARDGAYQGWQDALAMLENPRELQAQIAQAEAQLTQAETSLRQAQLQRDAAAIADENYQNAMERLDELEGQLENIPPAQRPPLPGLQLDAHLAPNAFWKAWVGVNSAAAAYEGAQESLNILYRMRNDPHELQAQVDAAETEYRVAQARVDMARAQLEGLQAGASEEELAAVEAQVEQAQAQVESARVVLDRLLLLAPSGGQVLEVVGHEGELAVPGAAVVTFADLDRVTLTIYVPENRLGQVRVDQPVEVEVDSFPERTFEGRVTRIASEAEFTPRNVQTQEERVNMVFAVEVTIPNPDHALKPGMPADAVVVVGEE